MFLRPPSGRISTYIPPILSYTNITQFFVWRRRLRVRGSRGEGVPRRGRRRGRGEGEIGEG
jgi:hypothetical protein